MKDRRINVLIPAAGSGRRMGGRINKVLMPLGERPVLAHTLRPFQEHPAIRQIGLILRHEDREAVESIFPEGKARAKLLPWIEGGAERFDSVRNGLETLADDPPDWILVHDGARPLCSFTLIDRILEKLETTPGVIPIVPITDTVRCIDKKGSRIVDRSYLYRTQTPQGFHWDVLWDAYSNFSNRSPERPTDDAQLLELRGIPVLGVEGDPANVKLTSPEDTAWAEWKLRQA